MAKSTVFCLVLLFQMIQNITICFNDEQKFLLVLFDNVGIRSVSSVCVVLAALETGCT